jgi:hypothetical protein
VLGQLGVGLSSTAFSQRVILSLVSGEATLSVLSNRNQVPTSSAIQLATRLAVEAQRLKIDVAGGRM